MKVLRYKMQNFFLNIEHLEKTISHESSTETIQEKRGRTQILIIDDEVPVIVKNLKNLGYLVTHKKDLKDISEVKSVYDIIIVDVLNVGRTFSENSEGAYLAYQIKLLDKDRLVYLFTGSPNDGKYNKYYTQLDGIYAKNQADDLIEQIDVFVRKRIDLSVNWKRQRQRLYNVGISTNEIAFLEHYFVKSSLKKKPEIFGKAVEVFNRNLVVHTDEVKKILDAAFKIVTSVMKNGK